jgi:zinc transporter ZupT
MHLTLLLATLAALLSGPLLYARARPRAGLLAFLDGFLFVSIFGLVLIEAVPGAFSTGGPWSLLFLAIGLLGPTVMETWLSHARREAHLAALLLAMVGLVVHSLGDGVALSSGDGAHPSIALPLAIAVHSLPVGLMVWWLLFPVFGRWPPWLAIIAMCIGTIAGYRYGPALGAVLGVTGWAWFQALVAGTILHVVFGRPHIDPDAHHPSAPRLEGLGNLCALAGLIVLARLDTEAPAIAELFARFTQLTAAIAPWLLALYALGAATAIGRGTRAAWRRGGVEWVDASAIWVVLALLLAAFFSAHGSARFGLPSIPETPDTAHRIALSALFALYAASLLRCGGRAWIARALPRNHHRHAD